MFPFYEEFNTKSDYFAVYSSENIDFPLHIHAEIEALYVAQGEITVFLNGEEYFLSAGDLAFVQGNSIHGYESREVKFIMTIFSSGYIPSAMQIMKKKKFALPVIFKDTLPTDVPYILNKLLTCESSDIFLIKGLLYQFIGEIIKVNPLVEDEAGRQDDLITRSIKELSEHYKEKISLEDMAAHLYASPCYLSRLFKRTLKCGINEYANRLRIEDAKNMLKQTNETILSIAMNCGFESIRTFNRVFKGFEGVTPKEYRGA